MRLVNEADIERLRELGDVDHEDSPLEHDMYGYAAEKAVAQLIEFWADMRKHTTLEYLRQFNNETVLADLDMTISALQAYRRDAEAVLQ